MILEPVGLFLHFLLFIHFLIILIFKEHNGSLRMYRTPDNRTLLPVSTDTKDGCNEDEMNAKGKYCFASGDARSNENLHLTSMHLIWARHHNYIAKSLQEINPHWDDETVFQESRKLVGAQIQHITYNEFVPILLGWFHSFYSVINFVIFVPFRGKFYI